MYGTLTETIRPRDTSGDLLERLARSGAGLLLATLDALEAGTAHAVPQAGDPSYAPKLSVDDARVRWDVPAMATDRQVRACTPAPGAWCSWRDQRLGLGPVEPAPDAPALPAGLMRIGRADVHVGTATVPVRLGLVRPPGKREMPAADWARGARLEDGEVLR